MTQSQLIIGMAVGVFFVVPALSYMGARIGTWYADNYKTKERRPEHPESSVGWPAAIGWLCLVIVLALAFKN